MYLALGTVIALIAGGYFFVGAIQSRVPIDDEAANAMQDQAESNALAMQEQLSDLIADGATDEAQERMDSPLGLAMFRKCLEWTEFHDNHPSPSAQQNRDKSCGEFRRYVESGELPDM